MKKLIECALPLSFINDRDFAGKTGNTGHPANLHMWWDRSSQASTLAALTASLVDAAEDKEELRRRLERVENGGYAEFGDKPVVVDPFSGFGGIPLAAQNLQLPVVAGDLNPVAVMLTKAATEIPARFANHSPINQFSPAGKYLGAAGLAEDVQYYGEQMLQEAAKSLKGLYPSEPEGKPAAWIWVRTVRCPNPACGCTMPLASSFVLNGKAGQKIWAEPVVENKHLSFRIHHGQWPHGKESNKQGHNGARFVCPLCGEITTDDYVKQQGLQHALGATMMAVVVDTENGRLYKEATETQQKAAEVPIPENIPRGEIPENPRWFSPPGFGCKDYAELFSSRQLTMLTTFCDLVPEIQNKAASDALAAGMSCEGGFLSTGGRGALAYGQAIGVYLAFVIDKLADRNSTLCSWNCMSCTPRATFGRQALPMAWTFAEVNPFSSMTGNFLSALKNVVASIARLPCGSEATIYQGDALTVPFPENVLFCTELPYYSNIGYAHLSDFFYIWMRRSLRESFPELFQQMVTPKEELSTVGQFYGEDRKVCEEEYEEKLRILIQKFYRAANPAYPTLVFFEYHRADDDIIHRGGGKNTPWEKMLQSLVDAGFALQALWPMRTRPSSERADGFRVLIVARKQEKNGQTTRRVLLQTMKKEVPGKIDTAFCAGVHPADQEMVAMGCGLSILTRYKKVLNADGTGMTIHEALPLIYQEIRKFTDTAPEEASGEEGEIQED